MPEIAVVIPSGDRTRDDSLAGLLQDLQNQTLPPTQIEVIRGISPSGRARNLGIERTTAEYLVFLDDDVRLGSPDVLEKLLQAMQDPTVGLAGTAQLLPPDSSPFQKRCAREIPRSQSDVVDYVTDSDIVTTACCMARREVLTQLGCFHDKILRGVDPELRHRYRRAGLRMVVAPNAWHTHPMPASWGKLWNIAYRNGYSSAFAQKHFPETVFYNPEGHVAEFEERPSLVKRLRGRLQGVFKALLSGRWGGLTYDVAYALGYLRYRLLGERT